MTHRAALAHALLLTALTIPAHAGAPTPIEDPIPGPIPQGAFHLNLQPIATGLTAPNWATHAPGASLADYLFVVDQPGSLWAVHLPTGAKSVFLNVALHLVPLGVFGPNSFDERGFLGAAFHPNYAVNGLLYTYTSEPATPSPDFSTMPEGVAPNHQAVIREWRVASPTSIPDANNPASLPDPASSRVLLRVDEPQFNHNAGCIAFGPDAMLYIAFGDGGGADDRDGQSFIGVPIVGHAEGNGQDPSNPLGSILRINPLANSSSNGRYGIPLDNPFTGESAAIPETYAYGFRNPFRFSFDFNTQRLYVADVGQNDIEEVDIVFPGGNYGWNMKEGSFFFEHNGNAPGFVTDTPNPNAPNDLIDPIAQYDHDEGVAIVGGFVARGNHVPAIHGRYIFGEFAKSFANDGRLFYLNPPANPLATTTIFEINPISGPFGRSLLGFGQDARGNVYALANSTGIPFPNSSGTHTGVVLRFITLPGDANADGAVTFTDLNLVLSNFGARGLGIRGDVNEDTSVNFLDLNLVLSHLTP